jgi:hypothetical protein
MLSSSFAETFADGPGPGERKTHTIVVEEADFVTVYWLLKWVYANWLLFRAHDSPKAAIEGVGAGWSARWLETGRRQDEWAWTAFDARRRPSEDVVDSRSVASVESAVKKGKASGASSSAGASTSKTAGGAPGSSSSATPARPPPSPIRRSTSGTSSTSAAGPSTTLGVPGDSAPPTSPTRSRKNDLAAHLPPALSPPSPSYPSAPSHFARHTSSQRTRQPSHAHPLSPVRAHAPPLRQPDPHLHPCAAPPPASALSMYQVAHRYGMPGLAALSLEHILGTITPQGSFALLLASATWEEVHRLVEVRSTSMQEIFKKCLMSFFVLVGLCCREVGRGVHLGGV